MTRNDFESNVFINCPFDKEYKPILEAIIFCLIWFGLKPRIATERKDSSESRLLKIAELIKESKYSIHDISRSQSSSIGEIHRMNMPFELGLDFGCMTYGKGKLNQKKFLVMEEQQYRYQVALSDLAGFDIETHGGYYNIAIRKVRNWIISLGEFENVGASRISGEFEDYRKWIYEKRDGDGFKDDDFEDYTTREIVDSMTEWKSRNST